MLGTTFAVLSAMLIVASSKFYSVLRDMWRAQNDAQLTTPPRQVERTIPWTATLPLPPSLGDAEGWPSARRAHMPAQGGVAVHDAPRQRWRSQRHRQLASRTRVPHASTGAGTITCAHCAQDAGQWR